MTGPALKWFSVYGRYRGHPWLGTFQALTLEDALADARTDPHLAVEGGHCLGDDFKSINQIMRECMESKP